LGFVFLRGAAGGVSSELSARAGGRALLATEADNTTRTCSPARPLRPLLLGLVILLLLLLMLLAPALSQVLAWSRHRRAARC
jgi:hypothetical protein